MNDKSESGIMDGHRRIGRHLARRRPEKQITAGRIAHRSTRHDLGLNFAAPGLDLKAGVVDLRSGSACGNNGPPDPGDSLPATQQTPNHEGLFNRTTRRMEIDRALRVFHILQETANTRGGIAIDVAFDSDPAVATGAA
ncbi:MAG: hypothetical protein ACXWKP_10975 [Bradyrhizobium sp.]